MALPEILTKLTHRETPELEYFWALEIWESGVKSAIWMVEEGKTKVVSLGSHEIWQETTEDLVGAADRSLATASERFPEENGEPSKVIFGLPYHFLEEEKIVPSWQKKLQTLCGELELSPLGFVLTIDALVHHLKEIEGVPPSAILASPQKDQIQVAVVELGKVEGVKPVARSENLAADVYEGLLQFGQTERLPSRILLFNGEDMEEARQSLMTFSWPQKLPFLHFPKIEILPLDFDIASICLAGGSEVAKSLGFKIEKTGEPDFGFVPGKDIKEEAVKKEEVGETKVAEAEEPIVPEEVKEEKALWEKLSGFSLPLPTLPSFSLLPLFLLMVFLLGGGVVGLFWFLPQAQIVIYVAPKTLEKEFEMTVDPNQEALDEANFILPGKTVEIQITGEKKEETTGKKTVGEKAKGEVTIFNTGTSKSLTTGTILTGPGGLKFTLDQEVMVSSGSGAATASQTKAAITAANIGAESNLAADSGFAIANFDKAIIQAKNSLALTGGTSRQIQAVSEEDQQNLLVSLTEELKEKGKTELLANIPSGKKLVEESISPKELSRNFSHKVGDEAATLNLTLKLKVSALAFGEDEFLAMMEKQVASLIPEGYGAKREGFKSQFAVEKQEKDGSVRLKVSLSADLLPKLEIAEITADLKGKHPQAAYEYLGHLPGFVKAEIDLKPSLPAGISTLPRIEKNIKIELRTQ